MSEENVRRLSEIIEQLIERHLSTLETIKGIKSIFNELESHRSFINLQNSAQALYYDLKAFHCDLSRRYH